MWLKEDANLPTSSWLLKVTFNSRLPSSMFSAAFANAANGLVTLLMKKRLPPIASKRIARVKKLICSHNCFIWSRKGFSVTPSLKVPAFPAKMGHAMSRYRFPSVDTISLCWLCLSRMIPLAPISSMGIPWLNVCART